MIHFEDEPAPTEVKVEGAEPEKDPATNMKEEEKAVNDEHKEEEGEAGSKIEQKSKVKTQARPPPQPTGPLTASQCIQSLIQVSPSHIHQCSK